MIHECTICHAQGEWTAAWCWFGSINDEDDGVVVKICSDKCKASAEEIGPEYILGQLRKMRGLPVKRKNHRSYRR